MLHAGLNLRTAASFQNRPTPVTVPPSASSAPRHRSFRGDPLSPQDRRGTGSERSQQLFLFGRDGKASGSGDGDGENGGPGLDGGDKKGGSVPFFGRFTRRSSEPEAARVAPEEEGNVATLTRDATGDTTEPSVAPPKKPKDDAAVFRSMAERARLEAERMDAELTLTKIDKLEKQLIKAKVKGDSVEDLQRQLDALQAKLRGETPPTPVPSAVVPAKAAESARNTGSTSSISSAGSVSDSTTSLLSEEDDDDIFQTAMKQFSMTNVEDGPKTEEDLKLLPDFLVKIFAAAVEMDYQKGADIDRKELAKRLVMMQDHDFSYSNRSKPQFSRAEIEAAVKKIEKGSADLAPSDKIKEMAGGNATQLAIYTLEQNYYLNMDNLDVASLTPEFLQDLFNQTSADTLISSLYPECTRKEGGEPTLAQVESLASKVLPAAKFSATSKPQKVAGGFLIPGNHKYENGDALLEAIDKELARTTLADKMTVLYAPYFVNFADNLAKLENSDISGTDFISVIDGLEGDPILYITGPDIVRESNRLGLTLTSILGIATSWYLSIYPFLLNEGIGKRVDQELGLLEANLQPDLSWLTDLSVPLFASFVGLQLVHEAAHRLVASMNGVKLSVPTFVPSLISGITSSVTTFKTPPKNKEAMFDISAAGPLAGIVASSLAIALGSKLTLLSDPSTLPALPLDILRQSTLGGAIIDKIITGALYVPEGAPVSGILIALHPLAIAGYISLIVNALSLLPVGSKCYVMSGLKCVVRRMLLF